MPVGRLWPPSLGAGSTTSVSSRGVSSVCAESSLPLLIRTPVLLDGDPSFMTSFIHMTSYKCWVHQIQSHCSGGASHKNFRGYNQSTAPGVLGRRQIEKT